MNKIVLKASAGTGKTYRISIEFIAELLKDVSFDEILVLTFTKKATGEIRERIFEFIKEIIFQKNKDLIKSVEERLENSINFEKLENTYEKMVQNKEKLKIYTIDSFLNQIFKKIIGPTLNIYNFEIIEDSENEEYYQRVLNEILKDKKHFAYLKEFFRNNKEKRIKNYYKFIKSFVDQRWKLKFIEKLERKKLSYEAPHIYIKNLFNNLEELKKTKTNTAEKDISEIITKVFGPLINADDKTIDLYIFKNIKDIFKANNFFNGTKFKTAKTDKPEMANLKEISQNLFEKFKEDLHRYIFSEEIIPLEKDFFEFGDYCQELYDKYKMEDKKFTFNDLSFYNFKYFYNKDLGLVNDGKLSEYLFDILEANIKTLFIDEFQDTSVIQWTLLKAFADTSSRLICVGDEKQSIYSWRGGEKELFENLENIVLAKSETMDTCYRSFGNIINFVNDFFGYICENNEEFEWNYDPVKYLPSKEGGFIETQIVSKSKEEDAEDDNAIERICSIIKNNITNYSKVAILARGASQLNAVAEALKSHGIPSIQSHNLCIVDHKAIKGLYSLIKYLNYNEYFYFLEFIRSDLVNISSQELKHYISSETNVKNYINDSKEFNFPFDKKIIDFVKDIKDLINNKESNTSIFDKLFKDLGITQKFTSNSDLKNIYKFYELSKNYNNLDDFIEFIEENKEKEVLKQVAVEELNAVTLMTVHKSKGLEFETVIYYIKKNRETSISGQIDLFVEKDKNFSNFPNYFYTNSNYFPTLTHLGYPFEKIEKDKVNGEEINIIYVALTRPKNNLFIVYEGKESIFTNALVKAMNVESLENLDFAQVGTFKETPFVVEEISQKESIDFMDFFQETSYDEGLLNEAFIKNYTSNYSLEKEFKRKIGSATHFYFENIEYNTEEELKNAKMLTLAHYGNMFGEKVVEEIFEKSDKVIQEFSWVFSKNYIVKREFDIFDGDKKYRIDRLIIDEKNNEIIIIDYKTGQKNEEQLENYKKIIESQVDKKYLVKTKFINI